MSLKGVYFVSLKKSPPGTSVNLITKIWKVLKTLHWLALLENAGTSIPKVVYKLKSYKISDIKKITFFSISFSLFRIHNETVNIWSHLIGFFIFFYCLTAIVLFPPKESGVESNLELLPLVIQLISYQVTNFIQKSLIQFRHRHSLIEWHLFCIFTAVKNNLPYIDFLKSCLIRSQ